ncbi:hypothetical protein BLSTO_05569, partial [Blastocystis sp. subtype 1]
HNWNEWENVHERVTDLVIPSNCCNEAEWSVFDVSGLKWLKSIVIGDDCFEYVDEVKLVGLSQLKRVVIGEKCFTTCKDDWPRSINPKGHFYLKNCEKLKELKMGHHSFSDYFVCEIDNLPSLEVIEMGELNEDSVNFYQASLELKNLPQLKSLLFGYRTLHRSSRVVFENLPELTSIRCGWGALSLNDVESCELIMQNLPKLTSLTTEGVFSGTFLRPRSVTLEGSFILSTLTSRHALSYHRHS